MKGRRSRHLVEGALLALLASCAAPLLAQQAPVAHTYGTSGTSYYRLNAGDFVPYSSGVQYFVNGNSLYGLNVGGSAFESSLHLPAGALLTDFELDACDTAADSKHVTAKLYECDRFGQNCTLVGNLTSGDNNGCATVASDVSSVNVTVDNVGHLLWVEAITESGDGTSSLRGILIGYRLQVSPAPGTATFGDVPTDHLYFRAIEALAASGITGGCGGGNFCPGGNVTRGEMAAFLARALGLHWP